MGEAVLKDCSPIDFRHSKSRSLFEYWQSLPRQDLVPFRHSFLPEEVPSLLSTMLLYELVSPDFIKIRLLGSLIADRFGAYRTGTNYLDFVEQSRRKNAAGALWALARHPCGMRVFLKQELWSGRNALLETVGLPLLNDTPGGNPLVIFQSNEVFQDHEGEFVEKRQINEVPPEGNSLLDRPGQPGSKTQIRYIHLNRREYFDLGAGVTDFVDR